MKIHHNLILAAMQSADPADVIEDVTVSEQGNWLTSFVIGDTVGVDWLLLLGGVLVFTVMGYTVYSMMLYNWVADRHHPANCRKFVVAVVLFLSVCWFIYLFRSAFGGLVVLPMLVIWLVLAVTLFITRRKVTLSQS